MAYKLMLSPDNRAWLESQSAARKAAGEAGASQSQVVNELIDAARAR